MKIFLNRMFSTSPAKGEMFKESRECLSKEVKPGFQRHRKRTRKVIGFCAGILLFALVPAKSFAGSWTAVYSGGTSSYSGSGAGGGGYSTQPDGSWGGTANGSTGATAGGTVTTTFTWTGSGNPPSSVIVIQKSTCSAISYSTGSSASATNGLGDTPDNQSTTFPPCTYYTSGFDSSGNAIPHYSIVPVESNQVVVYTDPEASASSPAGSYAEVIADVSVSLAPLDITVTGGATDTTSGLQDFLIGQQITATISIPVGYTNSSYSWSALDCTPFKSYTPGTTTSIGSETGTSFIYYCASSGLGTIQCALNLTNTTTGVVFTGTATAKVHVYSPSVTNSSNIGSSNSTGSGDSITIFLSNAPSPPTGVSVCGAWFVNAITEPTTPAPFTANGHGGWGYAQIASLGTTKGTTGGSKTFEVLKSGGGYVTSPLIDVYSVTPSPFSADGSSHYLVTSPSYTVSYPPDTSLSVSDTYETYVMYTPPAPSGTTSLPVPIGYYAWGWSASAVQGMFIGGGYDGYWGTSITAGTTPVWNGAYTIPDWTYTLSSASWY